MFFVFLSQSFEDLDGLLIGRLLHIDRLEAAFQCSVFFKMLPVLVQRGCTNDLHFALCQSRLQDIGCIDGAFCSAGTDHGMDLIHEEDDLAIFLHFIDHAFHALFKITTVFRTCNHCRKIQGKDPLSGNRSYDLACHDLLRQSFSNTRLTNAWFSDQTWIVLCSSA